MEACHAITSSEHDYFPQGLSGACRQLSDVNFSSHSGPLIMTHSAIDGLNDVNFTVLSGRSSCSSRP